MQDFFNEIYFNNSILAYLGFLTLGLSLYGILYFFKKRLEKNIAPNSLKAKLVQKTHFFSLFILSFYVASRGLDLEASVDKIWSGFFLIILVLQCLSLGADTISYSIARTLLSRTVSDKSAENAMNNLAMVFKFILWLGGILFLMDNLGYNVRSAIAGLGVGGIAVALAAQNILGDAFSSFVIFFDKPFEVGDSITVGDFQGTVEHIGLKTTRVRSISGELLVFGNSDLTSARLRNYKRMRSRRVNFKFKVAYKTPPEKLKKISEVLKEIIGKLPDVVFERAHFFEFSDQGLTFDVVYHVKNADQDLFMDRQQEINLRLTEIFSKEGIEFATVKPLVVS